MRGALVLSLKHTIWRPAACSPAEIYVVLVPGLGCCRHLHTLPPPPSGLLAPLTLLLLKKSRRHPKTRAVWRLHTTTQRKKTQLNPKTLLPDHTLHPAHIYYTTPRADSTHKST